MATMYQARDVEVNAPSGDNSPMIYIPAWIFLFLCPIIVAIRIWSRQKSGGRLGADDYTVIVSLVSAPKTQL